MKIKCPICITDSPNVSEPLRTEILEAEYEFQDLSQHWIDHHPDRVIRRYYARQLFKIHERINYYEEKRANREIIHAQEELKSLLDDKK